MSSQVGNAMLSGNQPVGRIEEAGFNWVFLGLAFWYVGGLFIDGWAHHHGRVDESFFTIWHAVFYSGFLFTAAVPLYAAWHNHRQTGTDGWLAAIPRGYGVTLVGSAIFAAGGVGDMIWHTLYGIEDGTEALVSPTHLMLALGMGLVLLGPLASAWMHADGRKSPPWYAIISAALFFAGFSFITAYLHPVYEFYPNQPVYGRTRNLVQGLGIGTIIFYAITLSGVCLMMMRRWKKLPFGFFAVLIGVNTVLMATQQDGYFIVPALLVAGLVADLIYLILRPSTERLWTIRIFAFVLPLVYFGFYYQAIWSEGLWWSVHVWAGSIFQAATAGLLVSLLVFAPPMPTSTG